MYICHDKLGCIIKECTPPELDSIEFQVNNEEETIGNVQLQKNNLNDMIRSNIQSMRQNIKSQLNNNLIQNAKYGSIEEEEE
jgi:hypothetical protein